MADALREQIATELRAQGVELEDCQTLARAIADLPPIAHVYQMREALRFVIGFAEAFAGTEHPDVAYARALLASPDAPPTMALSDDGAAHEEAQFGPNTVRPDAPESE